MVMFGIESYSKWNESKHSHKVEERRDKNLRLFLKTYMTNRMNNIYKKEQKTNKRKANINVISLNPGDPAYEVLSNQKENSGLSTSDFEDMGLSEEEINILLYIAGNGLVMKYAVPDLGMDSKGIKTVLQRLRENKILKNFLKERLDIS